jgi:hypothetical protein
LGRGFALEGGPMDVFKHTRWPGFLGAVLWMSCCGLPAHARVSLLVEEPFGHFGAFTATGHAAVFLSGVCAATPTTLRRCQPGENGVVISRYDKVGGYDWIAIPLVPYLYAVQTADDIPLFADPQLVAFLRNQYRREYLEAVAPDRPDGEPPSGNWVQLVGSAYDRTIYSFQIESSEEKDDEFIRAFNAQTNQSRFNLLAHNCADFAKEVINFYQPKAVHRSVIADAGITTPKQLAKSLTRFSARHPELELSTFVIPQVPGSMGRSKSVHGVLESLLKSKKYLLPLAILHPVITAGLAVAYVGGGRFDPAKNAMVLESGSDLEVPLKASERRIYSGELNQLLEHASPEIKAWKTEKAAKVKPQLDAEVRPGLPLEMGEKDVEMGISRDDLLSSKIPPLLAAELLTARLREELRRGNNSKVSESDVMTDWMMLKRLLPMATAASDRAAAGLPESQSMAANVILVGGAAPHSMAFQVR